MGDPLGRINPCRRGPKRIISMTCEGSGCYKLCLKIQQEVTANAHDTASLHSTLKDTQTLHMTINYNV